MPSLSIENLKMHYGSKKQPVVIFNDFNAFFEDASTHVIIGDSGCGKTSLLKVIAGLADYEGILRFDDIDVTDMSTKLRNVSYVSQDIVLYPHMTIFNNIAHPLTVTSASAEEIKRRVKEVAGMLQIEDILSRRPKQISLGQAQRAAIARAIIKRPNIFLFDEPFSNLDSATRMRLVQECKKLFRSLGATVLFVTHDGEEALALADKIHVMKSGVFVEEGTPTELYSSSNAYTRALLCEGGPHALS